MDKALASSTQVLPVVTAELFSIPLDNNQYLIYAPLRKAAFVGNLSMVNTLADLKEGSSLCNDDLDPSFLEFLRQLEILDAGPELKPITTFRGDPEPTMVTLFLTTACNLRCTYCYAAAGDTPTKFMPLATARRGIDFVARNAVKKQVSHFEISYHGGGEPTVNWHVMEDSLRYARDKARELGLEVHASSATNGVLNDKQIDWIIANLNGVSLSFDGLPSVHDRHRLTILGQGSSQQVTQTISRFDQAGFRYGIRVTVTADQIPFLADSIEYICSHFHPQRIQVEPSYQLGRWKEAVSAETNQFIEMFREAQVRAHKWNKEIFYSAARVGLLTNHFCGITQDSFALSPDGNVSACYEVFSEDNPWASVFFYGKPVPQEPGYTFDLHKLTHLRQQSIQHREYCQGCFAKWHCAGDCYHKNLSVNGTLEFAGSERCHITRELTKDQILTKIAQAGGLFWHEEPSNDQATTTTGKEMLL
ncbi:MAG: radical SAM protein [Nitrospirales bacterium]